MKFHYFCWQVVYMVRPELVQVVLEHGADPNIANAIDGQSPLYLAVLFHNKSTHDTTHDTRHTTHDTRHTTHDTRHTTHDTRHTTHDT
jgi:hypothetical protein